jgi:hypothetical protein
VTKRSCENRDALRTAGPSRTVMATPNVSAQSLL